MHTDTIIILTVAGIALFVWVPAIVFSVREAMKGGKNKAKRENKKQ